MKGMRYFLRNFTATATKEHLRSQLEDTSGSPELTPKEIELVRFIRDGSLDWERFEASRPDRS
jgi:hypothetical protein